MPTVDKDSLNSFVLNTEKMIESMDYTNPSWWTEKAIDYGTRLVISIIILVVGFIITKQISKMITRVLNKRKFDESLRSFLVSMFSISLRILVVITALGQLGVEMTSFIALIGAAGIAIGMAFSGTLGNFAGGIMILVFRPFKVGDFLSAQGEMGIVKEIQIFNTILVTVDNKTIIIPNGAIANGNMTNFTMQEQRRVDFSFGISYGDDYDIAKKTIEKFIEEDKRILKEPEYFIGLGSLGDSSVNITVRVWTKTDDYWPVFFLMNERVYKEFKDVGLSIPFPQMDVHIKKQE